MRKVILISLTNTLALFAASYLLPEIWVNNPLTLLLAGIVLGIVNLIVRPVLLLLALPINVLTLGLFTFVLNTWMVMFTAAIIPGIRIHGFVTAFLTALLVSLCNWLVNRSLLRKTPFAKS